MAESEKPIIEPETEPLTLQVQRHQLKWYPISEDKLDNLAFAGNAIISVFLGISAGALISFVISLMTSNNLPEDIRRNFISFAFASAILTAFFACFFIAGYIKWRKQINDIRKGRGNQR